MADARLTVAQDPQLERVIQLAARFTGLIPPGPDAANAIVGKIVDEALAVDSRLAAAESALTEAQRERDDVHTALAEANVERAAGIDEPLWSEAHRVRLLYQQRDALSHRADWVHPDDHAELRARLDAQDETLRERANWGCYWGRSDRPSDEPVCVEEWPDDPDQWCGACTSASVLAASPAVGQAATQDTEETHG